MLNTNMNVNLTEHFSEFINRLVESGEYENASEVMRTALRLLERQTEREARKLELLRKLAQEGLDSLDQERGAKFSSMEELRNHIAVLGAKATRRVVKDTAN